MGKSVLPKWQQEISSFKGIKSTFIIEGNINDLYPYFMQQSENSAPNSFMDLSAILLRLFNENQGQTDYDFVYCDPASGFHNKFGDRFGNVEEFYSKYGGGDDVGSLFNVDRLFKKTCKVDDIEKLSEVIRNAMVDNEREKPISIVMNFASRYISSPTNLDASESKLFLNLLVSSVNAGRANDSYNTLILVVEKFNDLPAWFFYNNPNVRTISIPNPDKEMRTTFIDKEYGEFQTDEEMKKVKDKFVDQTDGLKNRELKELHALYSRLKSKEATTELLDTLSIYKYGIIDNMWHTIDKEKIGNLESLLKKRVMGQDTAVSKTVNIVKRAVSGLSGMQHSSGQNKPRGVLFFAGPTGTGKTELTKALAEQLFGDENNCIRFDMSEYSEGHADQKLFGAPPGYVGYEAGGQLTNAIKEKPFSILLFDEVEKAHPSIMDKFLQILEDGRMTDGQGNTVYFSETLIIFTSNLGIVRQYVDHSGREQREQLVSPEETYDEIQPKVVDAIKNHFKPEVLNRIGNNIIVFDFIREEASRSIVINQMDKINQRVLKQNKYSIIAKDDVKEYFCGLAIAPEVREMGGRGIGNLMEDRYINPLSEYIFEAECKEGDTITLSIDNDTLKFDKM